MKQKYITTAAYYFAFILLGLTIGAEGPTLVKLAEHTSSRLDQISSIFFFGSFGYLLGSLFAGRLYDRVPGHRLMVGVLFLLGIASALVPVVTSLPVLVLLVFFFGFVKGSLDVGCNTLLLWVHNEKVGPFMNGLHAFFGVGAFLAPLIVESVRAATNDIYWVYWSFAIIAFPVAFFVWNLPSPEARAVPDKHKNAAFPLLPVLIMTLCFILYVGSEGGYGNWIYTYMFKLGLGTATQANFLTSAFWGFFTLGRLFGVWVSTRAKPLTILAVDFTGCLASLGLILLFRDSVTMLWVGTILLGISLASIFPTFMTLAEERMHVTGAITGWFLVGAGAGGMILPWMIGQAFVRVGGGAMMTLIFIDIVLNVLMVFFFTRTSTKERAVSESTATVN